MARLLVFTVPPDRTDALIAKAEGDEEVQSIRVFRGASLRPPGDVVQIDVTNRGAQALLGRLSKAGVLREPGVTFSSSEPTSLVVPGGMQVIAGDVSDASWEEMDATIRRTANKHANTFLMMAGAGALAAVGLAVNALELVLAGMVIAAEFEPLAQIGLGLAARNRSWRAGIMHAGLGALAMFAGALVASFTLQLAGYHLPSGAGGFLPESALVRYFVHISVATVLTDCVAAVAGALLILSNRSQLTAGISMALPLVPLTALPAVALVAWDGTVARYALTRWSLDVAIVIAASIVAFTWHRFNRMRRDMID